MTTRPSLWKAWFLLGVLRMKQGLARTDLVCIALWVALLLYTCGRVIINLFCALRCGAPGRRDPTHMSALDGMTLVVGYVSTILTFMGLEYIVLRFSPIQQITIEYITV